MSGPQAPALQLALHSSNCFLSRLCEKHGGKPNESIWPSPPVKVGMAIPYEIWIPGLTTGADQLAALTFQTDFGGWRYADAHCANRHPLSWIPMKPALFAAPILVVVSVAF